MKLTIASKIQLGLASSEVVEAYQEYAREWIADIHLKTQAKKKKTISTRKRPTPASKRTDVEILPTGTVVAGALVSYPERDDAVLKDYNRKQHLLNAFLLLVNEELNVFLEEIIEEGQVRIPGTSQIYYRIDGSSPEGTIYLNTGQLLYPTVSYVNSKLFVLGFGKQYQLTHTFDVGRKTVELDMVVGLMGSLLTDFSNGSALRLLGVSQGVSGDVSSSILDGELLATYKFITPIFFYESIGGRIGATLNIVTCRMDEKIIGIMKTCEIEEVEEEVSVPLDIDSFNVDFFSLEYTVGRDQALMAAAEVWLETNEDKQRIGITKDADATVTPVRPPSKDIIL